MIVVSYPLMAKVRFMETPLSVQPIEGGLKLGYGTVISQPYKGKSISNIFEFGAELRYNIKNTGWDLTAMATSMDYSWTEKGEKLTDMDVYIMVGADYNFFQGRKFNPYAGLGCDLNNRQIIVAPRIGVELLYHIRIETSFYLSSYYGNLFCISAGFAIGGRPKKD